MPKIIAGTSCKKLAYNLSQYLGFEYIEAFFIKFADSELCIQLKNSLHMEDVIIVQSTCKPVNDHLIELLLLVDAAKCSNAKSITAVIPYFGYSRQDKSSHEGGPISARFIANMLQGVGVTQLVTLDLHSRDIESFFKINVQNIDPTHLFFSLIKQGSNIIIVAPDRGSMIRAKKLSELLGCEMAIINKTRPFPNECLMDSIIGEVADKDCIIIDDIVDTGGTLCKAAIFLKKHGARTIKAFVTHGILSGDAIFELEQSQIEQIIITNSIPNINLPNKFIVVDVAPLISSALLVS